MEPRAIKVKQDLATQNAAFDNHQEIVFLDAPDVGLHAIIAIHDTALGPALGGTRMYPYASRSEALSDVLRLSSGMTLKNAIAGVPYGGGKATIIGNPKTDKTPELLQRYAQFINHFNGRFITGEDVGIRVPDADIIAQTTPHIRGTSKSHTGDPSPFTALGVYEGIRAAVEHKYCGLGVHGLIISIQGLGAVGMELAKLLHNAGAQLIVSDIRDDILIEAQARFGAKIISPDQAHAADADIFAPCALGGGLADDKIPEIRARIVAGSANNQLRRSNDGAVLQSYGILYAPDYVINAGGVISIAHDKPGFDPIALNKHICAIGTTLRQIFRSSERTGKPTSNIADEMARSHLNVSGKQGCAA